jgi:DNA-binding HxlR family transcriptional regulator
MEQQMKATKRSLPPIPAAAAMPTARGNGKAAGASNGSKPKLTGRVSEKVIPIGNVYQPECPAQRALEAIASKWAILILHSLLESPLRFNALQRKLPGISQKVLTEQLRRLERFGIIARTVHPTVPPSVEYSLTEAGRELKGALGSLCEWSNKHAAILLAGELSDAAARGSAKAKAAKSAVSSGTDAGR